MTPPNPLTFNMQGIETRPHDDPKRHGYLVRLPARGNLWMAVEDAIRSGLVPVPPPLPSGPSTTPDANRREDDERLMRELRINQQQQSKVSQ